MCNVHSDDLPELEKCDERKTILGEKCKKCGLEKGIVLLRANDIYCKECFVPYVVHKFRSIIGKSKLMKSGDWVLVAHSGGQASSALLHLIKDALDDDNKKKLKYTPVVLYVEEGAVLDQSIEERLNVCRDVVRLASQYDFPIYVTTLEMVYKVDVASSQDVVLTVTKNELVQFLPTDKVLEQRLKDLFLSVATLTAKEDLLLRLRHQLICKITKKLGLSKVFFGDTGTRLSVRLLADIAQGRGAQLSEDTGFSHNWGSQLLVLRPMREFVNKEVAVFNSINNINSICVPTLATKSFQNASISKLTEQFINNLQVDFPSTVSTVFRTGEKLCANKQVGQEKCLLCQGLFDYPTLEDTAAKSIEFSQNFGKTLLEKIKELEISKPETQNCVAKNVVSCCSLNKNSECNGEGSCFAKNVHAPRRLTRDELISHLCYGCRLVVREMKDIDTLPTYIQEEGITRCQRLKMKQEISEFLLDDENDSSI